MIRSIDELSLENQANYDRLLVYLMNYAFDHGIGIKWTHDLPSYAPPVSYDKPGKLIIMNAEWTNILEIPFQFAHEIGHEIHENSEYFRLNGFTVHKGESFENVFAIKLLQKYCVENDIYFSNWFTFAKCFCIPVEVWYLLSEVA